MEPVSAKVLTDPDFLVMPEAYQAFMAQIGFGAIDEMHFMVYSGPIKPWELYGERDDLPQGVLLFGDDFNGYAAGVRLADRLVVELTPDGQLEEVGQDFETFIRRKIAVALENRAGDNTVMD